MSTAKKVTDETPLLTKVAADDATAARSVSTRRIHPDEVALHNTAASCWVIVDGTVFDVTSFLPDHPGGEEYILQYGGSDVSAAMRDRATHAHSKHAFEMMHDDFRIGILDSNAHFDRNSVDVHDLATCSSLLKKRKAFIDVTRPMFLQLWFTHYSKQFYLEQVHIPRHVSYSAPIFGGILEYITLTPWYVVPLTWIPIWALTFNASLMWGNSVAFTCAMMPVGLFLWTFLEYSIHRFLFHVEALLPDNRVSLMIHFLMHGIHHYLPMDRMRLVMPPALSLFLGACLVSVFRIFMTLPTVAAVACGVIPGYVGYDMMHYYIHHGRPFIDHVREMKTYHLDHHYKEANLGFGITTKIWDRVFGTTLYG